MGIVQDVDVQTLIRRIESLENSLGGMDYNVRNVVKSQ